MYGALADTGVLRAACLLGLALAALAPAAAAQEHADEEGVLARAGEYIDGRAAVRLGAERGRRAGIRVAPLEPAQQRPVRLASGTVQALEGLLAARREYRSLGNALERERLRAETARSILGDLRSLAGRSAPPRRRLREAELEVASAENAVGALRSERAALRLRVRVQWGEALSTRFLGDMTDAALGEWLGQRAVVQFALPPGTPPPAAGARLRLDPAGSRARARPAELLGPAARPARAPGGAWLAETGGEGLPPGTRVAVWLAQPGPARAGVAVPRSAIIWHYGKPWMYLRHAPGVYLRTPLADYEPGERRWFLAAPGLAGTEAVVTGAQVLLSEEQRWNIPEEDDVD